MIDKSGPLISYSVSLHVKSTVLQIPQAVPGGEGGTMSHEQTRK